jgi:hypothetical protein
MSRRVVQLNDAIRADGIPWSRSWRVEGARCNCGGTILIDENGRGCFKYEMYCEKCLRCDADGWPTVLECLKNAESFAGWK